MNTYLDFEKPLAEAAARAAQVKRWKEQFHAGWWIEDAKGNWSQKP